jgi:signal transduction histidine kinase
LATIFTPQKDITDPMKIAPLPVNEQERQAALEEYYILDTPPETGFDDITRMASAICNTPVALINLIDGNRQWFKSHQGLSIGEFARDQSFCAATMRNTDDVFIVTDASDDEHFSSHPWVTGSPSIVFYAGVTLVNPDGFPLGTVCVMDYVARTLDETQLRSLQSLAKQTVSLLELRKKTIQLDDTHAELQNAYADLEKFSHIASHDLKSPLNNIISLTHLLKDGYGSKLDEEGNEYVNYLNDAAYQLSDLISGILTYSRSSQLPLEQKEHISLGELIEEVKELLRIPANTTISYQKEEQHIHTSRIALKQILLNLVHNAIKYNDKRNRQINISFLDEGPSYTFVVKDNGPGIEEEHREKIFELFHRLQKKGDGGESLGIGLAIVKRLVEKLGGSIKVESEMTKGTSFIFSIPK